MLFLAPPALEALDFLNVDTLVSMVSAGDILLHQTLRLNVYQVVLLIA